MQTTKQMEEEKDAVMAGAWLAADVAIMIINRLAGALSGKYAAQGILRETVKILKQKYEIRTK